MDDLERYGRKTIDVSLQGEEIYYFDFSISDNQNSNIIYMNKEYQHKVSKVAEEYESCLNKII